MAFLIQMMHVQTNMLMLKMMLIMTVVLMMTEEVETVQKKSTRFSGHAWNPIL